MTIFGTDIEIQNHLINKCLLDENLVQSLIKSNKERNIFIDFLRTENDGLKVFDVLQRLALNDAKKDMENGVQIKNETLKQFVFDEMNSMSVGDESLYSYILKRLIEKIEPKYIKIHDDLQRDKYDGQVPFGYPDIHKKVTGLLDVKIREGINDDTKIQYLTRSRLKGRVSNLTKEMFFAINKFNLDEENLFNFLNIVFQLSLVETAPLEQSVMFKENLINCLTTGNQMDLVHVKCLRFTYPKSGGVKILTDTQDLIVEGVLGKYIPKSEKKLFDRLEKIKQIFVRNNISAKFIVVLADDDLELLFPKGNKYVTEENKLQSSKDIDKYLKFLVDNYGNVFQFERLSNMGRKTNGEYDNFQKEVYKDLSSYGNKYIDPDFFDRDRVGHQYEYYRRLFGNGYSRDEAKRSICSQVASYIALSSVMKLFNNPFMVEENRGAENKMIANKSVPIFFTNLRDEAIFDVK